MILLTSTIAPLPRGPAHPPAILLIDIAPIVIDPSVVLTVATMTYDATDHVAIPVSIVMMPTTEAKTSMALIRAKTHPGIQLGDLHIRVIESMRRRKTVAVAGIGHIDHIGRGAGSGTEVHVEDAQDLLTMEQVGPNDSKRASL